ncbi:MAG: methyltransferase family protein [Marmoricola sp.]
MNEITPDAIMQIASGFMASKFLFAASELGVFDALKDDPADVAALAARVGLRVRPTRILADGCVALGLLDKQAEEYANTPASDRFLTGGGLAPGLRFWDTISYPAWARFSKSLAQGPAARVVELPPELQEVMLSGISAILAGPCHAFVETVDLSDRHRLLDLGCGVGSWTIAALQRHPHLSATLVDLPAAIGATEKEIASAGLAERAATRAADILGDPLPTGHDVVLLNNVVHYFSPATNRYLLTRIAEAVEPGALLVMADFWTDPTHTQPVPAALMAGEFAAHIVDGDVYSVEEMSAWLSQTGWAFEAHQPLAGPQSAVLARRV